MDALEQIKQELVKALEDSRKIVGGFFDEREAGSQDGFERGLETALELIEFHLQMRKE